MRQSGNQRRRRALLTPVIGCLVLAGCAGVEVLPPDPPMAEPGYPAYTPPVPHDPWPDVPSRSPEPTPSDATPEPEPVLPSVPAPDPATPTAPPSSAPPPQPAPSPSPAQLTLATADWSAACGTAPALVAPNPELTLTLAEPPPTRAGTPVRVSGWLSTQVETSAARFTTDIVVLSDNVVVAADPGAGDASPALPLEPGSPLEVPVEHDLLTECPTAPTSPGPAPAPTGEAETPSEPAASPAPVAASAGASANAANPAPADASTGTATAAPTEPAAPVALPLAPGEYTVIVAVRVAEGAGAPGVVATAAAPLTITD